MNLSNDINYIETVINKYFPEKRFPEIIYESMHYSLSSGGKRIRPLLMYYSSKTVNGEASFIEPLMASVEMIHTYSLIHDDLPCMDDDDFRRGQPTSHKKFNESIAVLTGDALLNLAYEIIIGEFHLHLNNQNYMRAAGIISKAAGISGMIGGQIADTNHFNIEEKKLLNYIHTNKTGALIIASVLSGALSANINEKEYEAFERFGEDLGLIFQITDDLLDMNEPNCKEETKLTFPNVYGEDKSREMVEDLRRKCIESLNIFGENANLLIELTNDICVRVK